MMKLFKEESHIDISFRRHFRFSELLLVFFLLVGCAAALLQLLIVPSEFEKIRQNPLTTIQVFQDSILDMKEVSDRIYKVVENSFATNHFDKNYSSVELMDQINQKVVSQMSYIENQGHADFLARWQKRFSSYKKEVHQYEKNVEAFMEELNAPTTATVLTTASLAPATSIDAQKVSLLNLKEELTKKSSRLIRDFQSLSYAVAQETSQNLESFGEILRIYFVLFLIFLFGVTVVTMMIFSRILKKIKELSVGYGEIASSTTTRTKLPPLPPEK